MTPSAVFRRRPPFARTPSQRIIQSAREGRAQKEAQAAADRAADEEEQALRERAVGSASPQESVTSNAEVAADPTQGANPDSQGEEQEPSVEERQSSEASESKMAETQEVASAEDSDAEGLSAVRKRLRDSLGKRGGVGEGHGDDYGGRGNEL